VLVGAASVTAGYCSWLPDIASAVVV
jgi:hypothetical protein